MLEKKYLDFFNDTLDVVKHSLNISIPIEIEDHGDNSHDIGRCYIHLHNNNTWIAYRITIDKEFVIDCYKFEKEGDFIAGIINNNKTLIDVICHEIAHTRIRRHGKKHTELTNHFISNVKLGKPHGIEYKDGMYYANLKF